MRSILWMLGCMACTGDVATVVVATPQPTPTTAPLVDCSLVARDACSTTDGCVVVQGAPLTTDVTGLLCDDGGPLQAVACGPDIACPAVEIHALDPDGTAFRLPAGCLPAGWTSIDEPVEECPADLGCGAISLEACADTDGCMLASGRLVETIDDMDCVDETRAEIPVACLAQAPCGDAPTVAAPEPDGPAYLFRNTCTPAGWTVSSGFLPDCPVACVDTPVADCSSSGCQLISGRPLQDDGSGGLCEDPLAGVVDLACMEPSACGDAITYATDGTTTYGFADTCTPSTFANVPGPFGTCP